jgi:tRNA threonylcarbamoyladenosine biosynthesis protein TsaB
MEKILAVETSGKSLSLAAAQSLPSRPGESWFDLKGEIFFDAGLRHSEILKDSCDFLLNACAWDRKDLTLLAVSTGPGSFTGLRVGISFMRALSQVMDVPLIGIPVFEILASQTQGSERNLCVLIDSIGTDVYAGFFRAGKIQPLEPYAVYTLPRLRARLKKQGPKSEILFAGGGSRRDRNEIAKDLGNGALCLSGGEKFPSAGHLARIALQKARKSRPRANSWRNVRPFYLRPPMAVERRQRRRWKKS